MVKKINSNSLNIVAYHYVREIKKSKYPKINGIEFSLFKKQIKYFKKKFNILPLEDTIEIINKKKNYTLKKPLLALTFDDGYKDHFDYVFPTLVKEKIIGFFYPPTDIFKKKILNVNKLQFVLSVAKNKKKLIDEILLFLKKSRINLKINNQIQLHNKKIPEFDDFDTLTIKRIVYKSVSQDMSNKICNYLFKKYLKVNLKSFAKELYLSTNHLKEMSDNKMHIGCHGTNHILWNKINGTQQKNQILESKEFFKKQNVDTSNFSVCFPWGSYNKDTENVLKDLKIKFGLTSNSGNIVLNKKFNKFLLPRFDANEFKDIN